MDKWGTEFIHALFLDIKMNNKQIIGAIVIAPVLLLLGFYVSGCIYFLMNGSDIEHVKIFTYIEQWQYYHSDMRYQKSLNIAAMGGFGITIFLPFMLILFLTQKKEELYGSARWANNKEIADYKLLKKSEDGNGILIGRNRNQFLYYVGAAFVFLAAASRTGKGIGIIIPNLLRWRGSVVVTDFKKENFSITSKFRQKVLKQKVYLFNPFDEIGETHCYNPLSVVREGHLTVPDILTIAEMLFPTDAGDATAKYFASSAQNLFLGLALYVKQTPTLTFSIGEIFRQSKGKGKTLKEHLEEILNNRNDLSEHCREALGDFLALDEEKGQAGVVNTMKAALIDWNNPIFDRATSSSDFSFNDLRKQRMTIYLGITPDYIPVAGRIINLFFSQLISVNTKELPEQNKSLKYRVLLLMDEFTAMGRSGIIAKSNNYFAGYGLQLLTIVQNPAQIEANAPEGYGKDTAKTFIGNHEAQLFYTPEKDDADGISRFLGDKTIKIKNVSHSKGGRSISVSETKRALMLPQELREMPFEKMIIMMRGKKAIFCDKIQYFQESPFIDHLKSVSPSLGKIKGIPTKPQLENAIADKELQIEIPLLSFDDSSFINVESPLDNLPKAEQEITKQEIESTTKTKSLSDDATLDCNYDDDDLDLF